MVVPAAVAAAVALVAGIVALVSRGSDGGVRVDDVPAGTGPSNPSTTATTSTTAAGPGTTATSATTASSGRPGDPTAGTSSTTGERVPTPVADLPGAAVPSNGDGVFAVVLAVVGPDAGGSANAELHAADAAAEQLGYRTSGAPVACLQGAAEALGVTDRHWAVWVPFWAWSEADQVSGAFDAAGTTVVGVVSGVAGCQDVGSGLD